jgi:class 3 adenylate cyclase
MERRLAADVVGYSRLMGKDKVEMLQCLKLLLDGLVQPTISAHKGRVVKLMGDGLRVARDYGFPTIAGLWARVRVGLPHIVAARHPLPTGTLPRLDRRNHSR